MSWSRTFVVGVYAVQFAVWSRQWAFGGHWGGRVHLPGVWGWLDLGPLAVSVGRFCE